LAPAVPQPAARAGFQGVAAGEDRQALEDPEVDRGAKTPVAGGLKRRFQVLQAQVPKVGPLHEPGKLLEQGIELVLLLVLVEMRQTPGIRVGIKGGVGSLQPLERLMVLEVVDGGEQLAKSAKRQSVLVGEGRIAAQEFGEFLDAQRNKVLANG